MKGVEPDKDELKHWQIANKKYKLAILIKIIIFISINTYLLSFLCDVNFIITILTNFSFACGWLFRGDMEQ